MENNDLFVMIDDDTDDQEIFKMAISEIREPLSCLFFKDCESAVAHFSQNSIPHPNYVFIDLNLPRIDGDVCLQQLQNLKSFDHPYIVIYSGSIPNEWRTRLENAGVDKFIRKTGSLSTLVIEIQHLIDAD